MNLVHEAVWYALYTRSRAEKKAAQTLSDTVIEVYCPLQKTRKRWHDRIKVVEEPVFRSYVFVRVRPEQMTWALGNPHVIDVVRHCGKPAAIREREISDIRGFLETYEGCVFSLSEVAENDRVRIEEGPFADYTGIVVRKTARKASIRLEMFNAYLVAEFSNTQYSKV